MILQNINLMSIMVHHGNLYYEGNMADKIKITTTQQTTRELTKAEIEQIVAQLEGDLALWKARLQELKNAPGEIYSKSE